MFSFNLPFVFGKYVTGGGLGVRLVFSFLKLLLGLYYVELQFYDGGKKTCMQLQSVTNGVV